MKDAKDFIPWKVTDISIRPYDGMWSMNPSIHFDGQTWRCVLRCCDYAMPDGITIRSKKAGPGHQTKNAMVIFDPQSWKPINIYKMLERDDLPRAACANSGYEDMRIFKTDRGGLQGIAASLHLVRDRRPAGGAAQHQPPEQVLLSFDQDYNIVAAQPIRGDAWSSAPQKNWVPFDHCAEPRFLYSIDRGSMFNERGALQDDAAIVQPSSSARAVPARLPIAQPRPSSELPASLPAQLPAQDEAPPPDRRSVIRSRGAEVQIRGGRVAADTLSSRPFLRPSAHPVSGAPAPRFAGIRSGNASSRSLSTGRVHLAKYAGLRGGTQLSRVGADAWLGIGHEMNFLKGRKHYWHTWYLVDSRGKLTSTSPPCKLVPNGIEFAAGMAIDGDRVVVSFGVDDMECKIGETKLSSVLEILRPVER